MQSVYRSRYYFYLFFMLHMAGDDSGLSYITYWPMKTSTLRQLSTFYL